MEPSRLETLRRSYRLDAALSETFLVLTLGASLIGTLGLLANSAAVVIGAMVIAPWILPLGAGAFAVIQGDLPLLRRALITLMTGVALTTLLAIGLGLAAGLPSFGSEVSNRIRPNLLDLAIALVAGAIATYAKLRRGAVSSVAGTAIAVALVPPVCVMGLLLSHRLWQEAAGAGLLFTTNLLGILSGGLLVMGALEPAFRQRLKRSRMSYTSFVLTALLLVPLTGSFWDLVGSARRESTRQKVAETISEILRRETLTLGEEATIESVRIDWSQNPPLVRTAVRVSDPDLPTPKQVAAVQAYLNERLGLRFRLLVERSAVVIIGPETRPNAPEDLPVREGERTEAQRYPLEPPPPLPPLPPDEPLPSFDSITEQGDREPTEGAREVAP
ncbi:DUF389 domain-containing protein [Synechococcus sp. RSCCF101]|uniref:DUF389 domain-containing protein n=1 Tax=Synechococcus sp. RSCCF101 TaxID=2511069 RepID=UPI001247B13D|nr:DUF389 domain-containing protein [Synechococcus sp. RSCCF101]QEY33076.1 DUF389 domain-containing protein [Synechococcus sp. RSCCF101]